MSKDRRSIAEDGTAHRTARRLGALFENILPDTPALFQAYGRRVSEISSISKVNPKGTSSDGPFMSHVGIDGTSIWSAATSGKGSIAVHLLACMLVRQLDPIQATALLVELVEERRKWIINNGDESNIANIADQMASRQDIPRSELAKWVASARAWILSADEVKAQEQLQLRLISKNVSLPVNSGPDTYQNVLDAWITAMTSLDKVISGMPLRISKGATLLGISAWHIFPNLNVIGYRSAKVDFKDPLVGVGGIITIGLQSSDATDEGLSWSLDLSYLQHYGDPVSVSSSLGSNGSRITISELRLVAFGSLLRAWGILDTDMDAVARFFKALSTHLASREPSRKRKRSWTLPEIWDGMQQKLQVWLSPMLIASDLLLEPTTHDLKEHYVALVNLGRRRASDFLSDAIPAPLFGLCNPLSLFSFSDE